MDQEAVKYLVRRWFFTIQHGCGRAECTTEGCKSNAASSPVSDANESAVLAVKNTQAGLPACEHVYLGEKLTLRIRAASGVQTLPVPLGSEDRLSRLRSVIRSAVKASDADTIEIRVASFPPKVLCGSGSETLASLGLQNMDTMVVTVKEGTGAASVTSQSATPLPASAVATGPTAPAASSTPAPAPATPASTASPASATPSSVTPGAGRPSKVTQHTKEAVFSSEGRNGFMVRRVVDADNSCLFTSIGYLLLKGASRSDHVGLRSVIADGIRADPETFSEVVLGQSPESYCTWIMDDKSWGGAIELMILSSHFGTQIAVVDCQSGRIDRYGDDKGFDQVVYLIYDGIHYDPIAMTADKSAPADWDVTVFSPEDVEVEKLCREIAERAKQARQFTDTGSFTLRCLVCQSGLRGEKEAMAHAKATGHQNFSEY